MNTSTSFVVTPVQYVSELKSLEMPRVKIVLHGEDDTTYSAKLPVFNGSGGLEAFFYVYHRFQRAAIDELGMVEDDEDTPDYPLFFKKFRMVLDEQALTYWDDTVLAEYPHARNHDEDAWNDAIDMMKRSFAGGSKAREQIIDYISTTNCRKPVNISVEQHVRRILQLINYANESNGDGPRIDSDYQKNKLLLQSFPLKWQRNWNISGNDLADTSVEELINYFAQQKVSADEEFHSKRGNKRRQKGGKGGGYKSNAAAANRNTQDDNPQPSSSKRTKFGDKYYSSDKKCPIHLHGSHKWGDCKDNKQSPNYVPPRSSNFRGGRGSGGGRGWQPRSSGQPSSGQQSQQQGNTQASRDHHLHDINIRSTNSTQSMEIDEHAYDMIGSPQSEMTDGGSRTGGSNATTASNNAWPPTRTDHPGYWADGALR